MTEGSKDIVSYVGQSKISTSKLNEITPFHLGLTSKKHEVGFFLPFTLSVMTTVLKFTFGAESVTFDTSVSLHPLVWTTLGHTHLAEVIQIINVRPIYNMSN